MRGVWAAGLLLVLLLPTVVAQRPVVVCSERCLPAESVVRSTDDDPTVDVFLYGHIWHFFFNGFLNTQIPSKEVDPELESPWITPAVETNTGTPGDLNFNASVSFWPGAERIEATNGSWRAPHRANNFMTLNLGEAPLELYAYVTHRQPPDAQNSPEAPGFAPRLRVDAWIDVAGRVFAKGSSQPFDIVTLPGEDHVYEVRVELEPRDRVLPGHEYPLSGERTTLVVRTIQMDEHGTTLTQSGIRYRAGSDLPWRLIMPVRAPLATEEASVIRWNEKLFVNWSVVSPFGTYDVDGASAILHITDASGTVREIPGKTSGPSYHDHDFYKPAKLRWVLTPVEAASLKGATIHATVQNLQGTYELVEAIDVASALEEPPRVPGPQLFVLFLMGLVPIILRRRSKTH